MYIAFKWLLGLTLTMWIAMCCLDVFVKKQITEKREGENIRPLVLDFAKNMTVSKGSKLKLNTERLKPVGNKHYNMAYLHCIMFIAGALVISVYNNINEIIIITQRELPSIFTANNAKSLHEYSKMMTAAVCNAMAIFYKELRNRFAYIVYKLKELFIIIFASKWKIFQKQRINLLLLKKLKETGEEKRNLADLLLAAIHENRNIRMKYQLENMAKLRLIRQIESTDKVIKENRCRYISFQQLYQVTHQENNYLKSRLKKVIEDKEDAEQKLLELVNEVNKSKNNDLKAFCSRLIMKAECDFLNIDVGAEIKKFLHRPSTRTVTYSNSCSSELLKHPSYMQITEISKDEDAPPLLPLISDSPKLKGLPGECVWTIKDKDGLIEKLFECDYETDFDTGDTFKRIREYSVYHDKDCLLDFSDSTTIINETLLPGARSPVRNNRFLTGSAAFKKFMRNNENVVSTSLPPTPRLLSE